MEKVYEFTHTAIMVIYKNGMIDRLPINKKTLHMQYFLELLEKSPYFFQTVYTNNINLVDKTGEISNISTYKLDYDLTKLGIIVVRNINVADISKDEEFLQNEFPMYLFSLPQELSLEQKNIINDLIGKYNLQDSCFCYNSGEALEDLEYQDINRILNDRKSLH